MYEDPRQLAEWLERLSLVFIPAQLRRLRQETGLTQVDFAEELGMSMMSYAQLEMGKNGAKIATLAKLAARLKMGLIVRLATMEEVEEMIVQTGMETPDGEEGWTCNLKGVGEGPKQSARERRKQYREEYEQEQREREVEYVAQEVKADKHDIYDAIRTQTAEESRAAWAKIEKDQEERRMRNDRGNRGAETDQVQED